MLEDKNISRGKKPWETSLASTCGATDITLFHDNQSLLWPAVTVPPPSSTLVACAEQQDPSKGVPGLQPVVT